jgi:hypothetical protein
VLEAEVEDVLEGLVDLDLGVVEAAGVVEELAHGGPVAVGQQPPWQVPPPGSSRPTRPSATSWSTAVATNALVWLATRKVWTGRGGWPVR